MNYTEEVLLRQQLALAVLMGGGAGRKTETVEQKEKSWEMPAAAGTLDRAVWRQTEERWERDAVESPTSEKGRHHAGAETKAEKSTAAHREDAESGWGGRTAGTWKQSEGSWMLEGGAPALDGTRLWEDQSGMLPAVRVETDARAVSRAVQRDARRYDGGFTIY